MPRKIAVLGIHTDIGKTVVSAVIAEALQADYWKPVQAGDLHNSDSIKVKNILSNTKSFVHREAVQLQMAASPHTAAGAEHRQYDFKKFLIPETENTLLIETAGGIFSPIDNEHTMLDFVQHFDWETVLVCRNYLGSINHTLLCLDALKHRRIKPLALIVNGKRNESSEMFIKNYSGINSFIYINELNKTDKDAIKKEAQNFLQQWKTLN